MSEIRWHDGLPDLEALDSDLILGPDGGEYMRRYHVSDCVRFHRLLADDPQRDLHDHPWDYVAMLLTGGYREHTVDGVDEHRAPVVLRRRAERAHRLELLDGPMLTLFAAGPTRRRWGFHTDAGWVHWSAYPDAGRYAEALDARPARAVSRRW